MPLESSSCVVCRYICQVKSSNAEIEESKFIIIVRPGGVMVSTLAHNTEDRWHYARELCSNQGQVNKR